MPSLSKESIIKLNERHGIIFVNNERLSMAKKNKTKNKFLVYIAIIIAIIALCGLFFYLGQLTSRNISETNNENNESNTTSNSDANGAAISRETYNGPELKRGYYRAENTDGTISVLVIFKNSAHCKYYPHISKQNEIDWSDTINTDDDEGSFWWYGTHWSLDGGSGRKVEEEIQMQINRINMYWHPGAGMFNTQRDRFWIDVKDNNSVLQTSRSTGDTTLYTLVREF